MVLLLFLVLGKGAGGLPDEWAPFGLAHTLVNCEPVARNSSWFESPKFSFWPNSGQTRLIWNQVHAKIPMLPGSREAGTRRSRFELLPSVV